MNFICLNKEFVIVIVIVIVIEQETVTAMKPFEVIYINVAFFKNYSLIVNSRYSESVSDINFKL